MKLAASTHAGAKAIVVACLLLVALVALTDRIRPRAESTSLIERPVDPCRNERASGEPQRVTQNELVLVTGGLGFIGSNLVALLLELGYHVRVLDNLSTGDAAYLAPQVLFATAPRCLCAL